MPREVQSGGNLRLGLRAFVLEGKSEKKDARLAGCLRSLWIKSRVWQAL
jgi:hypothetical protein